MLCVQWAGDREKCSIPIAHLEYGERASVFGRTVCAHPASDIHAGAQKVELSVSMCAQIICSIYKAYIVVVAALLHADATTYNVAYVIVELLRI